MPGERGWEPAELHCPAGGGLPGMWSLAGPRTLCPGPGPAGSWGAGLSAMGFLRVPCVLCV